jgi:outer membrane lipoprotein carrier protein
MFPSSLFPYRYCAPWLFGVVFCFALGLVQAEPAAPEAAASEKIMLTEAEAEALKALVRRLDHIQTLSGGFVQYAVDQKGTRVQESRGTFVAQRPGRFYWHTEAPLAQTVWSDGQEVTVYDPDLEQATVQPVSGDIQRTPAVLFSGGMKDIGRNFRVEERRWQDGESPEQAAPDAELPRVVHYLLTPRAKDSLFAQLRLRYENDVITEMRLLDSLGQQSTVSFEKLQVNPEVKPETFVPVLPETTDIIREVPVPAPTDPTP